MTMRRVLVTMSVPEENSTHDLAIDLELTFAGSDPTVWEWQDFFKDVDDGVVSPNHDTTEASS